MNRALHAAINMLALLGLVSKILIHVNTSKITFRCEDFDILTVSVNIKGENRNLINQCGHSVPHQLMSHDNRMEIIFASKQRDDRKTKGFKAIYNFVTGLLINS